AEVRAASGVPTKWLVIDTEQMRTPPPPLLEPLHWRTRVTRAVSVVTVVSQVPLPAAIGPAAPTQRVIVTVDGDASEMEPSLVTWLTTVIVQEMPCPPTLLAASSLHCITDGAWASTDEGPMANRVSASRKAG